MRVFATILLVVLCALAAWVALGSHSLLSYATSSEAFVQTARDSDLHGLALQATEATLAEELRQSGNHSPELKAFITEKMRAVLRQALDADWLYTSLGAVHSDVIATIQAPVAEAGERRPRKPVGVIELGAKKRQVETGLSALADSVEARCVEFFGEMACSDERARRAARASYQASVERASSGIPDVFALDSVLARAGKDWLEPGSRTREEIRSAIGVANVLRVAATGALILGLLLLVVINLAPISRLLMALGITLVVAAGPYLVAVYAGEALVEQAIAEAGLKERSGLTPRDDRVGDLAVEASQRLAVNSAKDAIHHGDTIALGALGAGVLMLMVGTLIRRQSD